MYVYICVCINKFLNFTYYFGQPTIIISKTLIIKLLIN